MATQLYKITRGTGEVYYAEIPEDKQLRVSIESQTKIWYENLVGGKYRGRDLEVEKTRGVPIKGALWLSFHPKSLSDKPVKKAKKKLEVSLNE